MTKLKELLDINERVEKHFNNAVSKSSELHSLKEQLNKLLIIQQYRYKEPLDYLFEYLERKKLKKIIENVEGDFEQIVSQIYNIKNEECGHDILLLINEISRENQKFGELLCPVCGQKTIKSLPINNSNIIDEIQNPNKKNRFGKITELEIEYLSQLKRCYLKNDDATVDDFFNSYVKEKNKKIKKKSLI